MFVSGYTFIGDADGAKWRAFLGAGPLGFDPVKALNHQCAFPKCK